MPSGSLAYKLKRAIRWRPEAQRLMTQSRSRCADGAELRADHRESRALQVWKASGELSRIGTAGRVRRQSATARTHPQARQFNVAFLGGGGGASHGAQSAGVVQQVSPPDDATWTEDRQGRDGTETDGSPVLDDASGMGLRAVDQARFARGTAQTSPWCAEEHREIDWTSRSSSPSSKQ